MAWFITAVHTTVWWGTGSGTLIVRDRAGYARLDGNHEKAEFDPRICVAIQESNGVWKTKINAHTHAHLHGGMRTRWQSRYLMTGAKPEHSGYRWSGQPS